MSKVSESPLLKCDTILLTVYLEIILNIQKTCNIVQRTFVYPLLGLISCSHFCLTCFIIVDIYMSVYLSTLFFFSYPFTHKCFWVFFLRIRKFVHDHCIVKNLREFNIDSLYRFSILHFLVLSLMFLIALFFPLLSPKSHTAFGYHASCFL